MNREIGSDLKNSCRFKNDFVHFIIFFLSQKGPGDLTHK